MNCVTLKTKLLILVQLRRTISQASNCYCLAVSYCSSTFILLLRRYRETCKILKCCFVTIRSLKCVCTVNESLDTDELR